MNAHKVFGDDRMAVNNYNFATARGHGKASDCVACGQCTDICPQHLPIIDFLKECAELFDKA